MATRLITPSNLGHAADLLRLGKLVAFPTDTFFALGVTLQEEAAKKLFNAKGRMAKNPVPVLISSIEQLAQVTDHELSATEADLVRTFWPGPLTLVLPAHPDVPEAVTAGTGRIGVRVPDHDLARELIGSVGTPVTGTSANLSGSEPCKTAGQVMAQLGGVIDAVVDAPCGPKEAPSTVVSFEDGNIRVLREGSVPESEIRKPIATDRT